MNPSSANWTVSFTARKFSLRCEEQQLKGDRQRLEYIEDYARHSTACAPLITISFPSTHYGPNCSGSHNHNYY